MFLALWPSNMLCGSANHFEHASKQKENAICRSFSISSRGRVRYFAKDVCTVDY